MRTVVITALLLASAGAAHADVPWVAGSPASSCSAAPEAVNPYAVAFSALSALSALSAPPAARALRLDWTVEQTATARRAVPVEYSDAYKVRARIHKVASFATLPLFAAMYYVGQDLYNHPGASDSKRGMHSALAASTGVLFGVNTVTGVWNLRDGGKDPSHRTRRMAHGVMMLVADAGFVATGLLTPGEGEGERDGGQTYSTSADRRSTHRTVALSSMALATVSYLMMLF